MYIHMYSYDAPVLSFPGAQARWLGSDRENRSVREQSIAILFHADTVTYPAW